MKKYITLCFVFAILSLISSCRSVDFIAHKENVKSETLEQLEELQIKNARTIKLTYNLINIVNGVSGNKEILEDVIPSYKEFKKMNSEFLNQKISRLKIKKYFKSQKDFKTKLELLVESLLTKEDFQNNQLFLGLANQLEGNKNRINKILKAYNSTIERNSRYINYPKF